MKNFTIRLAGQYFTICPVCDYITEYCKDYIVADVKRGAATETGGTVSESTPENSVACATESPVISRLSQLSRISTLSVKNPPEKISKRAFPSGIFPMPT